MAFSAIPDIMMNSEAVKIVTTQLGYPQYFIPFIGWAKLLGAVAILVPGFKSLKEWAYAGFFFDLISAVYSVLMTTGFDIGLLFMVLPIGFLFLSYFLWHRLEKAKY